MTSRLESGSLVRIVACIALFFPAVHAAPFHQKGSESWPAIFRILDNETSAPIAGATLNGQDKTDQLGRCETRVGVPTTVLIRAAGYVPHLAKLEEPDDAEQIIRLRRAVTIGGSVRDERDSPIPGAEVQIFEPDWLPVPAPIPALSSPTRSAAMAHTDGDGRWSCAEVPGDIEGVHITIHHPDYAAAFYSTAPQSLEAHQVPEHRVRPISWAKLRSLEAESMMNDGLPVRGVVLDVAGNPVAGATVRLTGVTALEEYRGDVKTGVDGRFGFRNGIAGLVWITAQVPGCILNRITAEISPGMPEIRVRMAGGELLKGRVIDERGRAVAGADLTARNTMQVKTDEGGRFYWGSAPKEPFMVHVRADGYPEADELVEAAAKENVIRLRSFRQIHVTGNVVDSETGQPIPEFQVLTSTTRPLQGEWQRYRRAAAGANGYFTVTLRDSFAPNGTVVQPLGDGQKVVRYVVAIKIQAVGYFPDTSRTVAIENGDTSLEVSLVRGEGISGIVSLPGGEPVSGARVFLCGRSGVTMGKPGQITLFSDQTPETITNASGLFRFAPQQNPRALVAVHEKGFGLVTADKIVSPVTVVLSPWGRIEGNMRVGSRPAPNVSITLGSVLPQSSRSAVVGLVLRAQTDDAGRFVFPRVPPGRHVFSRMQRVGERASAELTLGTVEVQAGATHEIALGGIGRPVLGKIVLRDPVRLTGGPHMLEIASLQSGRSESEDQLDRLRFPVRVAADGSFRIEDVPAGDYILKLRVAGLPNNTFTVDVTVPEMPGGRSDVPLDLGTVTIR